MKRGYQFVNYFPEWQGVGFTRLDPNVTDMAYIYDWYLWLGFWSVRKWSTRIFPPASAPARPVAAGGDRGRGEA